MLETTQALTGRRPFAVHDRVESGGGVRRWDNVGLICRQIEEETLSGVEEEEGK